MLFTYLAFLSFAFTALCAPSTASAKHSLASGNSDHRLVGSTPTGVAETLSKRDAGAACTDCDLPAQASTVPTPLNAAGPQSVGPASIPAPLTDSGPTTDASIRGLYSHILRTYGLTLDVVDAVMDVFVPNAGRAGTGAVTRRTDTPSIRELFAHSLRICGRALEGVDSMLDRAHDAFTGATPLAARELTAESIAHWAIEFGETMQAMASKVAAEIDQSV